MLDRALDGVRVIDFSTLLPGPFFTRCLLDLGATVVKVERPPHGDPMREMSLATYRYLNDGKEVALIDVKNRSGRAEAEALIAGADVVVEGFRPGVMNRLGLGYRDVVRSTPGIVYVSITGYGQQGPHSDERGHELNYSALAGMLALLPGDGRRPALPPPVPIGDLSSGLYALSGTLAALLRRNATGRGTRLDVAISDCIAHWVNIPASNFRSTGLLTIEAQRHATFNKPGYGVFVTRQGDWVAISALEDPVWERLVGALRLDPDLARRDRRARLENGEKINQLIGNVVADMETADVLDRLSAGDVPATVVVAPLDATSTEHARRRDLVEEVAGQPIVRFPVKSVASELTDEITDGGQH